ncbi:aminoglycoside phosphotransferase [Massilia sp. Root351]|uniref:APH(3') family aminoglycoside O-phosphotransferase n=1 Tax=Massilia sp. Root351 TaxID=1736522 RepID=UPI000708BA48|nr:APH(3') family aminoglycoside O-phosphotransferase [Massilia sp. Root351]KQV87808.1 aminoglycoside phosphotransferase [Massilia sp. Root351]
MRPPAIAGFIGNAVLRRDKIGESPCQVHSFKRGNDQFFLKASPAVFAPTTYSVRREAAIMRWLSGRLNVPEVVLAESSGSHEYMITRAVPGVPLSARIDTGQPVMALFLEALRQLQSVPAAECPFDAGARLRLRELDYLLGKGLIDEDYDLEPWPGLATPQDLVARLHATVPQEDLVFAHGDLGDSNVLVDKRDQLYFIDFGRGGLADRWMDIAFAHRNLREEESEAAAAQLLVSLGMPDAGAKREFFEQLDELF